MYRLLFSVLILLQLSNTYAQVIDKHEQDKCGNDVVLLEKLHMNLGDHWGYNYDSLLGDLSVWEANDYVNVSTIGESTLGRDIYELTITDFEETKNFKHRIYIHARTHPGEVQSFYVTNAMIDFLTAETPFGDSLRENCIFHIIPMYNPDGVELEYPRENANNIDIESNWSADAPEIEVEHLKYRFSELMMEENPIEVALNMHSALACKRYFVYHKAAGTSIPFTDMEKNFIGSVRNYFFDGFEPYTYYTSWSNGTPNQYPESWWWLNYQEQVMALTYEDMNCSSAGFYDKSASAILNGISTYLGFGNLSITEQLGDNVLDVICYPIPFSNYLTIEWNNYDQFSEAIIYDLYGRVIKSFNANNNRGGQINWDGNDNFGNQVSDGTYLIRIIVNEKIKTQRIIKN